MQGPRLFSYHFTAAQIEGFLEVRFGDSEDAFNTVIDEGEAAGLLAIPPHLNVLGACQNLHTTKAAAGLLAPGLPL